MKKLIVSLVAVVFAVSAFAAMNYVQPSGSLTLTASGGAVAAGDIVQVGSSDLVGVAMSAAPSNGTFVAYTSGIFQFATGDTNAVPVGTTMYKIDDSGQWNVVTVSTNSGLKVGISVGTALNGDILVDINR